jgi:uncharacterized protein with PIN domain
MALAYFHFFDELNDFLPLSKKDRAFPYCFTENPSVKHLIEALGVPHPEVGQVLVNDHAVAFNYRVQDGDRVEVHPPALLAAPYNGGEPRFVLDNHLGKLATYLRILGFDTLYANDYQDERLAEIANRYDRILLTRDRHLLMRKAVTYGYWVRNLEPDAQVAEVMRHYWLYGKTNPFKRCLRCNQPLQPVRKEDILDRLEPLTKRYYDEFCICPACKQIYWKGSHYEHMLQRIDQVFLKDSEV